MEPSELPESWFQGGGPFREGVRPHYNLAQNRESRHQIQPPVRITSLQSSL